MNKIAVLLTAYNGKQWIDEQIQSILDQTDVSVDIFISVDFSTDGSYEHIKSKYSVCTNVFILPYGERYGSAGRNFFRIVLDINFSNYDYISFADQDDIWLKDKLSHAIDMIKKNNVDAYSSNVTAFWKDGKTCLINKSQTQVAYDYLFEAAGPGCTYVFTKRLAIEFQAFIISNSKALMISLHDWLLYAYARSHDYSWYIDSESRMLYRQHDKNEVGANSSFKSAFKRYLMVKSGWYKNEVLKIATLLNQDSLNVIENLHEKLWYRKLKLIFVINQLRRRGRDRLALSCFILFGCI